MTLADHLPPAGWADVATTRDLDHLRSELHATIETGLLRERAETQRQFNLVHAQIASTQRNLFFAVLAAFTANTGIVVAVLTTT